MKTTTMIAALVLVTIAYAVGAAQQIGPQSAAVVTIDPPCPLEPPRPKRTEPAATVPVRVRYNPGAPGAKLTTPETLTLNAAINASSYANNYRTFSMSRLSDGTWETTIPVEPFWAFLIFLVKDQNDRIDSNQGNYWQILSCGTDGRPTFSAISYLTESYGGYVLAPGIQRPVNYAYAISILEEDLKRHPERVDLMSLVWSYRIKQSGNSDSAYAQITAEIEKFVVEHKTDERALTAALRFVAGSRRPFPETLLNTVQSSLIAVNPKSPVVGELIWRGISQEKDPQRRALQYREFIRNYPQHDYTQPSYVELFATVAFEIKDVPAAEQAFEEWRRIEPDVPDVLAAMGRFYAEEKTKPAKAIELLTQAITLCEDNVKNPRQRTGHVRRLMITCSPPDPSNPAPGQARLDRDLAQMRYYRGLAHTQQGALPAAIQDLEFATRIRSDSVRMALRLAELYEKSGRREEAFKTYLHAATVPQQTSGEPMVALERFFLAQKMGRRADLDNLIAARSRELRAKAAAEFKPVPLDRETPSFEFTTLDGSKVDNSSLRGQLVILNFWADWCGPCAAEMPGFLELQRRNPNVKVIGVAVLSELKNVQEIIKRRKWSKLTMAHSEATGAAFGITSVPQTYVIDKEGRLRFVHTDALADVVPVLEKELALIATK